MIVLISVLEGARQGIGRKLTGIGGLLIAIIVVFSVGQGPAKLLQNWIPYPLVVLQYLGAALAGWIAFALVSVCGLFFCKKTNKLEDEVRSRNVRWGAVLGGGIGLFLIALCTLAIGMSGTLANIVLANTVPGSMPDDAAANSAKQQSEARALLAHIDRLNSAIMDIPGYHLINWFDPVPAKAYRIFDKLLQVSNAPEATQHFVEQPRISEILRDPLFANIREDEDIKQLLQRRDLHALLSNRKIRTVLDDPALMPTISGLELENALDAALNRHAIAENNAQIPSDAPYQTVPYAIE